MFVEYRCTSFEKFTWYLVNTSSFLDINFVHQFCYSVCLLVWNQSQSCFLECFFLIRSMLGWLFSSKIIPLPISFATFTKKELKVSHTSFLSFNITLFSFKTIICWPPADFFDKNDLTVGQKLFALWPPIHLSENIFILYHICSLG